METDFAKRCARWYCKKKNNYPTDKDYTIKDEFLANQAIDQVKDNHFLIKGQVLQIYLYQIKHG